MKYRTLLLLLFFSLTFVSASNPYSFNLYDSPTGNITINQTNNYYNVTSNVTYLNDLADVLVPAPSDGESLVWSSSLMKWISETVISRWIVSTANGFLYNDSDTLYFNETKLNETIDERSPQALNNSFNMYFTTSMFDEVDWNFSESDQSEVDMTIETGDHYIFGGSVF